MIFESFMILLNFFFFFAKVLDIKIICKSLRRKEIKFSLSLSLLFNKRTPVVRIFDGKEGVC